MNEMGVTENPTGHVEETKPLRCKPSWATIGFLMVFAAGGFLRFEGLGIRSLWRDEICTWHVSRMPLAESLRWGPELTKPPLYQFVLRALTRDPHPDESLLRLPAAVCGLGIILAGWWLGRLCGSTTLALALAGLLAFHPLQIYYSQEARPYSMLVLGCMMSTGFWIRLVRHGGEKKILPLSRDFVAYILSATLSLYAHYLALLTLGSHALWWLIITKTARKENRSMRPAAALSICGLLAIPLVVRYLRYRTSVFQGLEWIASPTIADGLSTLSKLTFSWPWVGVLLPLSILLWLLHDGRFDPARSRAPRETEPRPSGGGRIRGFTGKMPVQHHGFTGKEKGQSSPSHDVLPDGLSDTVDHVQPARDSIHGLLIIWLAFAWFGLMIISWVAHPAMVPRYALPAAIPALLLPLLIAHRLDRRAPMVIMAVFILGAAPKWLDRTYDPGIREMVAYLNDVVDPTREIVVQTMDPSIYPGWEDSERIVFDYYPLRGIEIKELRLGRDGKTAVDDTLGDPRGMYLIVLWADPFPVLENAGRSTLSFRIAGRSYSQLNFPPYRLVHVAPISNHGATRPRDQSPGATISE